jgi:hypothetical protein
MEPSPPIDNFKKVLVIALIAAIGGNKRLDVHIAFLFGNSKSLWVFDLPFGPTLDSIPNAFLIAIIYAR